MHGYGLGRGAVGPRGRGERAGAAATGPKSREGKAGWSWAARTGFKGEKAKSFFFF